MSKTKYLSTGANFVRVYIEIWDKSILKFNKFSILQVKKNNNVILYWMLLLSFMKFLDWNEKKIDTNLFITQFVIICFYICRDRHTDDPGKYKKSFVS